MVTIKHVAREVGLSITTVSRALNDHADVAPGTRERVEEAARRLGYHPNHAARSLQGTRTNAIGLVLPRFVHRYLDSFWLEFIGGVTAACMDVGIDLMLSMGNDLHDERAHYQRLVRTRRVDGVILCDLRVRDPRISFLRQSGAPFVAFGRTLGPDDFSWVDVDGAAGVRAAMEHLLALGHRRIAFLNTQREFSFSHYRLEGYMEALVAAGLPYDADLAVQDLDVDSDLSTPLTRALSAPLPPTALIACADSLAVAAARVLRRQGLEVPGDVSLVAIDDTLVTRHADPPLTCVRQDNGAIGALIAERLFRQLSNPSLSPTHVLISPTLVVRQSTAAPVQWGNLSRATAP